uniref:Uncharacterized protein n=1 Tax=Coccidioides posadasii RMSCC 3488 TaxID=454284 RepID=A0A0J6FUJ5_COCPO|nr:hypothetical protein CPAG_09364 [Coccidioides posadasii RMSCC 3488]
MDVNPQEDMGRRRRVAVATPAAVSALPGRKLGQKGWYNTSDGGGVDSQVMTAAVYSMRATGNFSDKSGMNRNETKRNETKRTKEDAFPREEHPCEEKGVERTSRFGQQFCAPDHATKGEDPGGGRGRRADLKAADLLSSTHAKTV